MAGWSLSGALAGWRSATARRDLAYVLAVALVGAAVALVNVFTTTDDLRHAGRPVPIWEPAVWEVSSVLVLVLLTPSVMALTRAVRPLDAPWARVLGAHLLAAVVFSLIHVAGMGVLRWLAYAAGGADYSPLGPLQQFLYELRKDLLTYVTLVAVYTGWLRLWGGVAEAPAPSQQPAIEVRDGARRRFVPLGEVAWIEAAGNYVELHRGLTPILHRASLTRLERDLRGLGFVRIHRSRLVRRDAIAEVESKPSGDFVVRLSDGRELAGSRRFRRPLLEP